MRRVAVLADVHGNLPALEAVLADVAREGVDRVVLAGDLADGPFPVETLERIAALGGRALCLRGNGDRWLAEARAGRFRHPDPATDDMLRWCAGRLSAGQAGWLAALPLTARVEVEGRGAVDLCHATARSDNEMFLVDGSHAQAAAAFAGLDAGTIVAGHGHMPFDRLIGRRRLVNAGSVGMPYGHAGASWALVGRDIVLRRTDYDAEAAAARIAATSMPGAAEFADTYVRRQESDAEAVEAYRAVVARQQATSDFG